MGNEATPVALPSWPEGEGVGMGQVSDVEIPLDRDVFLRTLVRELATSLESVIGLEEASGYVSLVGQAVGTQIDEMYLKALGADRLTGEQVAEALVDLKRRINGDFCVIEHDEKKIVLGNRVCPFAEKVVGRESMCMMTSNVFGTIAARNLGYARVELEETIARGDAGCRVVVHLVPDVDVETVSGREYFGDQAVAQ
ncbi:methanogen output domain 1-containing protein [Streptomyces sp. NPDC058145]|uniref:methanogen output domain 1-containing protein n=1 Tax=Streptomyces sp. NPDC058145 TaxID=3346356 RepID=UPI0036E5EFD2